MTTPGTIRLALLSGDALSGERAERRSQLAAQIATAPDADLLVLPYLAAYPPFWNDPDRAVGFAYGERFPFPTASALVPAVIGRGIPALVTIFEVVAEGVFYATAVMIEATGESRSMYRQQHAVNAPRWHERLYFQPGEDVCEPEMLIDGFSIGLMLGGDVWVPEVARLRRLAGTHALLAISGAPAEVSGEFAALARARAIENGVPVVWSTASDAGLEIASATLGTVSKAELWTVVSLSPDSIATTLRADDPLMMRRPRLYRPLTSSWQKGLA